MPKPTITGSLPTTGAVLCPCGGQIISNSGKTMLNLKEKLLHCWNCETGYLANDVYFQRREGQTVTFDPSYNECEDAS